MRKLLVIALLGMMVGETLGQNVDYNKVILPTSVKAASIEERLVQIAWENQPQNSISYHNVELARLNLSKAKWAWLAHISATGNLNEFTIKGRTENAEGRVNNFYPRYNFSVRFDLSSFATNSLNVKSARTSLKIQEDIVNDKKLLLRADVLKRFSTYKTNQELLKIQSELLDDIEANFKLIQTKFRNSESTLNEYNAARERYENQRIRKITAENVFIHSKLDLEQLLGLRLEDVL
jgi:outer membrane protein TolC